MKMLKGYLYSYYDNGVKIDVYKDRKPKKEEKTWASERMAGSVFNLGRKQETMKAYVSNASR
jgi:hypothetical protein